MCLKGLQWTGEMEEQERRRAPLGQGNGSQVWLVIAMRMVHQVHEAMWFYLFPKLHIYKVSSDMNLYMLIITVAFGFKTDRQTHV